ncbi:hypothetical protein MKZ38_004133 [Zalerion maritima]|uniref:Chloride channel protein n=1 Tax=Zalerion maritima TaxID=339359 RepID=A0AAD5RN95_9PEZI|nr:hypothetical protein MKZ38_004133 [Zalerion maritima]
MSASPHAEPGTGTGTPTTTEQTALLSPDSTQRISSRQSLNRMGSGVSTSGLRGGVFGSSVSLASSTTFSTDERALSGLGVGERLPYNDYTTIDWVHDLVKDSVRHRAIQALPGIRGYTYRIFDRCQGVIAATLIGILTALVAFCVDVSVATVSGWKEGYCSTSIFSGPESCCRESSDATAIFAWRLQGWKEGPCDEWVQWSDNYWASYTIYVLSALAFGAKDLDSSSSSSSVDTSTQKQQVEGKAMYMSSGSGIPEIKTILSGFVIPNFLTARVLITKAIGAIFAVATGLNLGKEGPFVHISTCAGNIVASLFHKYKHNERRMREMLSVACSAGLSVAFGAPIGGVLFSYEEISTYFPRRQVLWRAFLCSGVAAATLKQLNPTGTGKLVLFETGFGEDYSAAHYPVFVFLGVVGGIFGGVFCRANFLWSKHFRKFSLIKNHPVLETSVVVIITALLQFPNHMIRQPGDVVMTRLLVDCRQPVASTGWLCVHETATDSETRTKYFFWLIHGTVIKLLLTIITFGCKVPSGIIIPSLDAGALFGRLISNALPSIATGTIEPGLCALVGSAAFLAGVSRMTVSLAVVVFELTGEVTYILPVMTSILVAKWIADAIEKESVYDLAQTVLGHPFLDVEGAGHVARTVGGKVCDSLLPPRETMSEITLTLKGGSGGAGSGLVSRETMEWKLDLLKRRGLIDAGVVVVDEMGRCRGYIPEVELEWALNHTGDARTEPEGGDGTEPGVIDLFTGPFGEILDRTPMMISADAPVEYAVELFGKMGLRYVIVVEDGRVVGVIIKKRLVGWLDQLRSEH